MRRSDVRRGSVRMALGAAAAALLFLGACGGEDSGSGMTAEEPGETPPVSAEREGAGETAGAQPPVVGECLDLVEAGELEQAASVCAEAARAAPQNEEVQDALREARTAAGDAAGAAEEGASEAQQGAEDTLGEASEDM